MGRFNLIPTYNLASRNYTPAYTLQFIVFYIIDLYEYKV
jgi:hypothetical protein